MKKLQNDFTTPEQSKRLLELGVPADSANCYTTTNSGRAVVINLLFSEFKKNIIEGKLNNPEAYLPCWSVGRLNEIFKICSDDHVEIYDFDLEGTQIERAMQAFENYVEYNWLDFSKLEDYI